jgi:hypothetical protein
MEKISSIDSVRPKLYDYINEYSQNTGFPMSDWLNAYLVNLLASKIRETGIQPEPSWGEKYLILSSQARFNPRIAQELRQYADQCLWASATVYHHNLIKLNYIMDLGSTSYIQAAELLEEPNYDNLGKWFNPLHEFLYGALYSNGNQYRLELVKFFNI